MGADVSGAGTSTIHVNGAAKLSGASRHLRGDYIEAGSWAVAAAVTGGEVEVGGIEAEDLEPIVAILTRMHVDCEVAGDRLIVHRATPRAIRQITHGTVARVSERYGEPSLGPRDAGQWRDADARLDVRAAVVRARAAERDGSGYLPVRLPIA